MADYIHVSPISGFVVKHPDSFQDIPASGKRVRSAAYWIRMAEQGLVKIEEVQEDKELRKKAKKPKKAKPEFEAIAPEPKVDAAPEPIEANPKIVDPEVSQEEVAK